jgi:hypothetical protein
MPVLRLELAVAGGCGEDMSGDAQRVNRHVPIVARPIWQVSDEHDERQAEMGKFQSSDEIVGIQYAARACVRLTCKCPEESS